MIKKMIPIRPIKELLFEEYWNIAYREAAENDFVFIDKSKDFKSLRESKQYWYADPFLFEYKNEIWLFTEAFDNISEKGLIACMKYVNGTFSEPEIVLEEDSHLSYPYVYEENGEVYMMPETMADGCIQIYKAVDFPHKWIRHKVLLKIEDAVDTVRYKDKLITSVVTDSYAKKVNVDVYDVNTGDFVCTLHKESQLARGAGKVVSVKNSDIRPAQDCTDGVYGAGLVFYHITDNGDALQEKKLYTLKPGEFSIGNTKAEGVHTYARSGNLEVLDFKRKRFNLRRLLWIIKRKL